MTKVTATGAGSPALGAFRLAMAGAAVAGAMLAAVMARRALAMRAVAPELRRPVLLAMPAVSPWLVPLIRAGTAIVPPGNVPDRVRLTEYRVPGVDGAAAIRAVAFERVSSEIVRYVQSAHGVSERRSCAVLNAHRRMVRYRSVKADQTPLLMRIRDLARVGLVAKSDDGRGNAVLDLGFTFR